MGRAAAWKEKLMFVQARHFADANRGVGDIHRIVVHTAELQEERDAAEDVAQFFATTTTKVSAHACIDNNSIVECVRDEDVAFHALGDNDRTLGVELSGFARQTAAQWNDAYSKAMLTRAAKWCAEKAARYDIPVRWLTAAQERARVKGFVTHKIVSDVWGEGIRSDPGPNFPYDAFLEQVKSFMPPPPQQVKRSFRIATGEGTVIRDSIAVIGNERAKQKERLLKVFTASLDGILDEFDREEKTGEPQDVRVQRRKA